MAFIPVLNCVQARLQYLEDTGILAENVFYVATTSAPTPTDLDDIGGLFHTWCLDSAEAMICDNWQMTGVALRAMNEEEGISVLYVDGFPLVGDGGSTPAPNQVSYTVTWSTGLSGRSARGRTYGVGLGASAVVNGNRLSDGVHTAFQTRWDALRAGLEAGGHALQVVSFVEAGVPRVTGRALPVLSTNVRFPIATQRRRLS